jgi:hypothetical protein
MNSRRQRTIHLLLVCFLLGFRRIPADASPIEPDTSLVHLFEFTNAVTMRPTPARAPVKPSDPVANPYKGFAFLYEDEVGNRIDTIAGTLTKDLGTRRDTTITFRFSDAELRLLYSKLIAIGFFDLPHSPKYLDPGLVGKALFKLVDGEPNTRWIRILARTDTTIHEVAWGGRYPVPVDYLSDDLLRLHEWINEVWTLVVERRSYRDLPTREFHTSEL